MAVGHLKLVVEHPHSLHTLRWRPGQRVALNRRRSRLLEDALSHPRLFLFLYDPPGQLSGILALLIDGFWKLLTIPPGRQDPQLLASFEVTELDRAHWLLDWTCAAGVERLVKLKAPLLHSLISERDTSLRARYRLAVCLMLLCRIDVLLHLI